MKSKVKNHNPAPKGEGLEILLYQPKKPFNPTIENRVCQVKIPILCWNKKIVNKNISMTKIGYSNLSTFAVQNFFIWNGCWYFFAVKKPDEKANINKAKAVGIQIISSNS